MESGLDLTLLSMSLCVWMYVYVLAILWIWNPWGRDICKAKMMYESLSMWILPRCCLKLFLQAQLGFTNCVFIMLNVLGIESMKAPYCLPKSCSGSPRDAKNLFSSGELECAWCWEKKCDQLQNWHSPPLRCSIEKSLLPLTQLTRTIKFWLLPLFYRGWQRAPEFNINWRSLVQLGMRTNSWASSACSFHLSASPEIDWIPKHYRIFTVHAFAKKVMELTLSRRWRKRIWVMNIALLSFSCLWFALPFRLVFPLLK